MKLRPLVTASVVGATLMVSACNDKTNLPATPPTTPTPAPPSTPPTPPAPPSPMAKSITDFVASLIAMVTGSACNTALPADVNGQPLTDDMTNVDANAQTVNCTS